jgi:peroxisome-assembly ATPase
MNTLWFPLQILQGANMQPCTIEVAMGRTLSVPRAAGKICCYTFTELCGANVGSSDYIALVNAFHTIALKGVPVFTADARSSAYRFVKLIDLVYEHRVKLLVSAEAYAEELFQNVYTVEQGQALGAVLGENAIVDGVLGFEKDRTRSRLTEMQTIEYAIAHAERHEPGLVMALQEAKERSAHV